MCSSSAISFTGIETTSPFVPAPELLMAGSGQPSSLFSAAAVTLLIILVNKSSENNEWLNESLKCVVPLYCDNRLFTSIPSNKNEVHPQSLSLLKNVFLMQLFSDLHVNRDDIRL